MLRNKYFSKKKLALILLCVGCFFILVIIAGPTCQRSPKSHQGEAKVHLAAIYNTLFRAHSDYETYATCLEDLGYEVNPRGYYIVGFNQIDQETRNLIISKGQKCSSSNFAIPKSLLSKEITPADLPNTFISSNKFTAVAVGRIVNDPDYPLDIWTIDQDKHVVHVQDGSEKISFWKRFKRDYLD